MNKQMPKTLLGFYARYAFHGNRFLLCGWFIAGFVAMADASIFPLIQRAFISLFEATPTPGTSFLDYAMPTILMCIAALMLVDVGAIARSFFAGRWKPRIYNQLNEALTDYAHRQSMSFWTGRMPGKIYSQINYVANGFNLVQNLSRILVALVIIAINVGLVLNINKYVAIVLGCVFLFRIIYGAILIRPMNRASEDASDASSNLSGKIIDSISNYSVVKLFAGGDAEHKFLVPHRNRRIQTNIYSAFIQRLFWAVPSIVWNIAFGAVMILCVILFSRGQLLVSEIVFTMSVFFSVMGMISHIIGEIPDIVDTIGSATKSYRELVKPINIVDVPNASDLVVARGAIEIKNVSFKYKHKYVLRDFSLSIKPGERVGLVGASGAGKTTLVNLIMRFYEPTRGQILIDGQDIRDVRQDSLRRNIAFIPQEPTMFNRTLRENIEYGRPGATDIEIRRAARLAAADKFIMATDKKYETKVGDRGIKLSGGQRQRVAIARAFLKDAPILVLDEATSALDSETEIAIQSSFERLAAGRTTIAIAHRLSTLRNMDRIIVIEHGRVIEQGTHSALLRRGGEYARLWHMQSGGFIQGA